MMDLADMKRRAHDLKAAIEARVARKGPGLPDWLQMGFLALVAGLALRAGFKADWSLLSGDPAWPLSSSVPVADIAHFVWPIAGLSTLAGAAAFHSLAACALFNRGKGVLREAQRAWRLARISISAITLLMPVRLLLAASMFEGGFAEKVARYAADVDLDAERTKDALDNAGAIAAGIQSQLLHEAVAAAAVYAAVAATTWAMTRPDAAVGAPKKSREETARLTAITFAPAFLAFILIRFFL